MNDMHDTSKFTDIKKTTGFILVRMNAKTLVASLERRIFFIKTMTICKR